MMPRRLAVALVLPATAGMCAAVYLSGLAWPILTTAYGLLGKPHPGRTSSWIRSARPLMLRSRR